MATASKVLGVRVPKGNAQLFLVTQFDPTKPDEVNLFTNYKSDNDPNSSWIGWRPFSDNDPQKAILDIAVAPLSDGRLQFFGVTWGGSIISTWQETLGPGSAWHEPWNFIPFAGREPNGSTTSAVPPIAAAQLSDGRIQVVAANQFDGKLYSIWKQTIDPNSDWTLPTLF